MMQLTDQPESELGAIDNGLGSHASIQVCKGGVVVHGVFLKDEIISDILEKTGRRAESLSPAEAHAIASRVKGGGPLFPDRNPEMPGDIMDMLHLDHEEELAQRGGRPLRTHCERLAEREAQASLYDGIPHLN